VIPGLRDKDATSSPASPAYGQFVTLTTTVLPSPLPPGEGQGEGSPTGTVEFYDGATFPGSATVRANGLAEIRKSGRESLLHGRRARPDLTMHNGALCLATPPAATSDWSWGPRKLDYKAWRINRDYRPPSFPGPRIPSRRSARVRRCGGTGGMPVNPEGSKQLEAGGGAQRKRPE